MDLGTVLTIVSMLVAFISAFAVMKYQTKQNTDNIKEVKKAFEDQLEKEKKSFKEIYDKEIATLKNDFDKEIEELKKTYAECKKECDTKLEKKHTRLTELENEKIKMGEALDRTFITSKTAYETFVTRETFEREIKLFEHINGIDTKTEDIRIMIQQLLDKKVNCIQ